MRHILLSLLLLCGACAGARTDSGDSASLPTPVAVAPLGGELLLQRDGLRIVRGDYLGWPAISLLREQVATTVVPGIGRLVAFGPRHGANRLWLNPDFFPRPAALELPSAEAPVLDTRDWRNYGGYKVWLYPSSGWPPDPALDGSFHRLQVHGDGTVELASPRSARNGVGLSHRIALHDDGRLEIVTTLDWSWRLWPVLQAPDGTVRAPVAADAKLDELLRWPEGEADPAPYLERRDGELRAVAAEQHAVKVELRTADGWLAREPGGPALRWDDHDGFDASFFFSGPELAPTRYLELEAMSPPLQASHSWRVFITLD